MINLLVGSDLLARKGLIERAWVTAEVCLFDGKVAAEDEVAARVGQEVRRQLVANHVLQPRAVVDVRRAHEREAPFRTALVAVRALHERTRGSGVGYKVRL